MSYGDDIRLIKYEFNPQPALSQRHRIFWFFKQLLELLSSAAAAVDAVLYRGLYSLPSLPDNKLGIDDPPLFVASSLCLLMLVLGSPVPASTTCSPPFFPAPLNPLRSPWWFSSFQLTAGSPTSGAGWTTRSWQTLETNRISPQGSPRRLHLSYRCILSSQRYLYLRLTRRGPCLPRAPHPTELNVSSLPSSHSWAPEKVGGGWRRSSQVQTPRR